MSKNAKIFLAVIAVIVVIFLIASSPKTATDDDKKNNDGTDSDGGEAAQGCTEISQGEWDTRKGTKYDRKLGESFWWAPWVKNDLVNQYREEAILAGTPNVFQQIFDYALWAEAHKEMVESGFCIK